MASIPKYEIRLDSSKVKGLIDAIKELGRLVPEWQKLELDEAVEKIGEELKRSLVIIHKELQ